MSVTSLSLLYYNTVFTLALLTVPGQPRSLVPSPVPYWPAFTLESLQASQFEAGGVVCRTSLVHIDNNRSKQWHLNRQCHMVCVSLVSYVSLSLYTFSNSNKEIYKKAASRTKDSYVKKAPVVEKSTSFGTHHCCSCPFRPTTVTVDT